MEIILKPTLYKKQYDAIFDPRRYVVIEASTKSGKTLGCLKWLLSKALQKRGIYYWIAPIYPQARIAYQRMKDALHAWIVEFPTNDTNATIRCPNGSTIWFKGSSEPDSLYGEEVSAAVIDEATRCKEEAWHAVRSTLTHTEGPCRLISNVTDRKNFAYALARKAESGEPGWGYHKITAWDAVEAGVLKKEEIEDAKRSLPPAIYDALYLAIPAESGSNPFGDINRCVRNTLSDPIPGREYVMGVDLAKSVDASCFIVMDLESGDVVYYEVLHQVDWDTQLRRIQEIASRYNKARMYVDATGLGDPIVEQLQRMDYAM